MSLLRPRGFTAMPASASGLERLRQRRFHVGLAEHAGAGTCHRHARLAVLASCATKTPTIA
jgi:hypothetical protein